MGDMVWAPSFTDVDAERAVILEEIAMYEDDPQDKVFDVLGRAVFGDHPLGRAVLGSADVVAGTPVDALRAFHAARYGPRNIVVSAAGSLEHDAIVALTEAAIAKASTSAVPPAVPPAPDRLNARRVFETKDTEQFHVCLGGPGIARHDERRYALRVLDTLFGGTSSSRLFQEVREKRGLAYSVYSFSSQFHDAGQVGLYVGTRADNLAAALEVVGEELRRLRCDPASADELSRAKENLKGRIVLSLESTSARMNRLGSSVLTGVPLLSLDEVVERIEAVTVDDVAALAEELYAPEVLSAAGIGPSEDEFAAALEPVGVTQAAPKERV
jgi:predicted Zn-dependent peptidase